MTSLEGLVLIVGVYAMLGHQVARFFIEQKQRNRH